eukprot:gene33065-44248_t
MSTIGIMEGAFFVGRKEIVDWINSTLDLNLTKIEDTASGAVACQLFDIMYPNQVPMHKVNWAAKQDFEFIANYKILQTCFTKLNIERNIDVDRLISGRYMDNLEFMQWYKRFFEMSVTDKVAYDPYAQRLKGKGGATYGGGKRAAASKPSSAPMKQPLVAASKPASSAAPEHAHGGVKGHSNQENAAPNLNKIPSARDVTSAVSSKPAAKADSSAHEANTEVSKLLQEISSLKGTNTNLTQSITDMRTEMDGLEKERDFYFDKLREIEVL